MKFFSMRGSQEKREHITDTVMRRTLYTSVLTLALCIVCFLGTTWAWFSESIESTSTITAASFTVGRVYKKLLSAPMNAAKSVVEPEADFVIDDSSELSVDVSYDPVYGKLKPSGESVQAYGLEIGSWIVEIAESGSYTAALNDDGTYTIIYTGAFEPVSVDTKTEETAAESAEADPAAAEEPASTEGSDTTEETPSKQITETVTRTYSSGVIPVKVKYTFYSGEYNGFSSEYETEFTVEFRKTETSVETKTVEAAENDEKTENGDAENTGAAEPSVPEATENEANPETAAETSNSDEPASETAAATEPADENTAPEEQTAEEAQTDSSTDSSTVTEGEEQ